MNEHYDGFAVYRKYLAYKLHFTTDKYDYTEHSGMIHTKLETFTKRNDRYMFHKLSVKYNQDEIDDFMIANFLKKNKAWSGSLLEKESHEIYLQYKRRTDSSSYFFKEDCSRILTTCDMDGIMPTDVVIVRDGQHPILLRHCIGNKISTETLIIMDYHLNFMRDWNKNITDKIVWPDFYKKVKKFKPFLKFNQTETKLILREVFL